MDNKRFLSLFALAGCLFAFCVIALGAYTRLIDAGLGCPDWPGCYGHLMVPHTDAALQRVGSEYPGAHIVNYKAWAEMLHRYAVGGLSLFILSIIVSVLLIKEIRITKNVIASCMLIILLCYQILLGQLTVTLKLLPIIVSQHLLGGFLILSTLWIIYLMNRNNNVATGQNQQGFILVLSIIGLVLLFLQISLGAWTSTNYASLSCADFPFCINNHVGMIMQFKEAFTLISPIGVNYDGGVLPETVRQTIQMTHRLGALTLTSYWLILMAVAYPRVKASADLLQSLHLILGLISLQIGLGISNVLFKLPLITAMFHNLTAVLLLLSVITFIFKLALLRSKVSE